MEDCHTTRGTEDRSELISYKGMVNRDTKPKDVLYLLVQDITLSISQGK